jgi:hypothetical protein
MNMVELELRRRGEVVGFGVGANDEVRAMVLGIRFLSPQVTCSFRVKRKI